MDNVHHAEREATPATTATERRTSRWRLFGLMLLVGALSFIGAGCDDDRYYGSRRSVHGGYYASYAAPGPYYYNDGYGYRSRGDYGRDRYRSSRYRTRSAYLASRNQYSDRRRDYRRSDRRRRGEYRQREVRVNRGERRSRRRAAKAQRAVTQDEMRPVETQPE